MSKTNQTPSITKEFVIGFGFLEGIWIAVGVSPDTAIINAFIPVLKSLGTPTFYLFVMKILPMLAFILTLIWIWKLGGWLGLLAVALAFLGGVLILKVAVLSIILALLGLAVGYFAFPT